MIFEFEANPLEETLFFTWIFGREEVILEYWTLEEMNPKLSHTNQ